MVRISVTEMLSLVYQILYEYSKANTVSIVCAIQFPVSAAGAPPPHLHERIRTSAFPEYYGQKQGRVLMDTLGLSQASSGSARGLVND
ncbi:hypothetical protein CJF32_00001724 [Rutstroemia sp. NJR-2017a WRK4]|nr:hypothetical protein CJF32_00001724 [Rutstroemia sp. NJR-2017a WRK4]